jgi:exodeoxyribonuclease VII large subunit
LTDYIHLSELLDDIKNALDKKYSKYTYRVIAEITDIKIYYNRQYAFLNLIEKTNGDIHAAASAVIWRDNFHIIREFEKNTGVNFNQNLELILEIEIQYHIRYGLRLSIVGIDAAFTLGKLEQEKQETLKRLIAEHPKLVWQRDDEYRSANHLLKLPVVMQKIALIAAPGSDGRRDFLHELTQNEYGINYSVLELPAQVQGEAASGQIALQLEKISKFKNVVDAIAIVRGGGANTDFSAFDSYRVALAIAQCPYPVYTGIGHERNVSIADLLSFASLKTPTKCADAITNHNLEFLGMIQNAKTIISRKSKSLIEIYRNQLQSLQLNLLKSAQWNITQQKQFLNTVGNRLIAAMPTETLQRGFALVRKNGKHIYSSKMLEKNDLIEIEFADGKKLAKIEND